MADDKRMSDNPQQWYFRVRSREAIVDMFRCIKHLQQLNGFKRSEIIQMMANVQREKHDYLLTGYLLNLVSQMKHEELRGR
jgi:hypothetical protein